MSKKHWAPTRIKRVVRNDIASSTTPVVVLTDQGRGYLKTLGNREGPQVLACEFIGTSLANWLGIPTFDFCVIPFDGTPEIQLSTGGFAESGACFITREESGEVWDGTPGTLRKIVNSGDITRLVCLDTWTRNQDRYFPRKDGKSRRHVDNVFLSDERKNELTLTAFDFTHAFTNGRDVTKKLAQDAHDNSVYGIFPEFKDFLDHDIAAQTCEKLKKIKDKHVRPMITQIPKEWEIDTSTRNAWIEFIITRASSLSKNFLAMTGLHPIETQHTFSFDEE